MRNTNLDANSLRKGLESVPREIYDQIYDFVFTALPGERHIVIDPPELRDRLKNKHHQAHLSALKLLHVSHASRAQFASSYYRSEFSVESNWFEIFLPRWLLSLPQAHLDLLLEVTVTTAVDREKACIQRRPSWSPRHRNNDVYPKRVLGELRRPVEERLGKSVAERVNLRLWDTVFRVTNYHD